MNVANAIEWERPKGKGSSKEDAKCKGKHQAITHCSLDKD